MNITSTPFWYPPLLNMFLICTSRFASTECHTSHWRTILAGISLSSTYNRREKMVTKKIFCTRKTLFNVSRQSDKLKGYFTQKCKFNLLFLIPNIYDFLSSMKQKRKCFLSTATENKSSYILITINTHYIWTITFFTIYFVTWKKRESHWFGTTYVSWIHQVLPALPCIKALMLSFIIFVSSIYILDSQIRFFYSSTVFHFWKVKM